MLKGDTPKVSRRNMEEPKQKQLCEAAKKKPSVSKGDTPRKKTSHIEFQGYSQVAMSIYFTPIKV